VLLRLEARRQTQIAAIDTQIQIYGKFDANAGKAYGDRTDPGHYDEKILTLGVPNPIGVLNNSAVGGDGHPTAEGDLDHKTAARTRFRAGVQAVPH